MDRLYRRKKNIFRRFLFRLLKRFEETEEEGGGRSKNKKNLKW